MNMNLDNRMALVCGASQGMGAAIEHELALLGANVVALARNADNLEKVSIRAGYTAGTNTYLYSSRYHRTAGSAAESGQFYSRR